MNFLFQSGMQSRMILEKDWKVASFDETVSTGFHKLYKKKLKVGMNIKKFIDQPISSLFTDSFQLALEGEIIHRKKNINTENEDHWFQFSFFPLSNGMKKITQILYQSEDVTYEFNKKKESNQSEKERRASELYLKNSKNKWQSLVESSPNLIFTLDNKFNITYVNYAFPGLKIKDVIGSNYLDYTRPEDQPEISRYLNECLARGMVREYEIKGIVNGELTTWFLNRIAPIRNDETSEIDAIIGIASEITDRKTFEAELLESEERFRAMADNAPVLIWISGTDSLCNFFNQPWLEFTGKELEEEIGEGWAKGIHPEDYKQCMKTYLNSFNDRKSFEMEYRLRRHDGEFRWLLDRGVPLFTLDKEFTGFIGSCIDITERKKSESRTIASLEEKEILLKEIHHRVKNNLQIISSLLNLQAGHANDLKSKEIFQSNLDRVKSIALMHDLLNISDNHSQINISEYLKLIANYLRKIYAIKVEKINLILESDDILMATDVAIYFGIIANELISNAFKYAFPDKHGEIKVKAILKSQKTMSLIISDNGVGFPKDFDLNKVKSLGLKLVNMLTSQMNGSIAITNKTGLVFHIQLPVNQKNIEVNKDEPHTSHDSRR